MRSLRLLASCALAAGFIASGLGVAHAVTPREPAEHHWSFDGPFGTFDRAALQRGFQVYKEVCASCHTLDYLAYRNLADPGGPGFTMAQVEVLAAEALVPAGPDETGEILDENGLLRTRPALPSDKFARPYGNEQAARAANNGALPPDLSLITKARLHGPDYVYAFVSGFAEAPHQRPACLGETPGVYYNPYFESGSLPEACVNEDGHPAIDGSLTSMAPQLMPDRVTYADGTEATTEQMAQDVTTFLHWAADPHMERRKKLGFEVMIYLGILSGFLYIAYKKVWANVEH